MEYACYTCNKPIKSMKSYHIHNMQTHSTEELSLSLMKLHEIFMKEKYKNDTLTTDSVSNYQLSNSEIVETPSSKIGFNQSSMAQSIKIIGKKLDAMVVHFENPLLTVESQDQGQFYSRGKSIHDGNHLGGLPSNIYTSENSIELTLNSNASGLSNSKAEKFVNKTKPVGDNVECSDIQPVKVAMRSGRISKSNKCNSEFVYFDARKANCEQYHGNPNNKHSLHSKCKAAISHKCLTSKRPQTISDADEESSSKDKLLNIFGSDFDFDGWLSANEIDISIEDLDLTGFDDFEGVLPENRTLTIENLIEDLEITASKDFGKIPDINCPPPAAQSEAISDSVFLSPINELASPLNNTKDKSLKCLTYDSKSDAKAFNHGRHCYRKTNKKCVICKKSFKTKNTLMRHMTKYHNDHNHMKFQCFTCGERFAYMTTFERHIKKHNPQSKFMCEQCGKVFVNLINLKTHQSVHDRSVSYDCPHCRKTFYHKNSYSKHLKLHNTDSIYKCEPCQKTFPNRSTHLVHMKRHSSGKYLGRSLDFRCNSCGESKTSDELNALNPNQKLIYVTCNSCHRGIYKRYLRHNSIVIDDNRIKKNFDKCTTCKKDVLNLHRHIKEAIRAQIVTCEICDKSLKTGSLKSHMHRRHQGSAVVCEHCNKIFKNVLSLQEHLSKIKKGTVN